MECFEFVAHVALSLAKQAYVLGGGRIRYHGTAEELKQRPDVLQSAYLRQERSAVGGAEA